MGQVIVCPGCGERLTVPDAAAGKKGRCRKCGAVFTAPALRPTAPPAPASPPPSAGPPQWVPAERPVDKDFAKLLVLAGVFVVGGLAIVGVTVMRGSAPSRQTAETPNAQSPAPEPDASRLRSPAGTPPAVAPKVEPQRNVPSPQDDSARQLLQKMWNVYADCKSYRDSGVIVRHVTFSEGEPAEEKDTLTTAFVRPGCLRFDYRYRRDDKDEHYIIWAKDADVRTWWDRNRPAEGKPESLEGALFSAAGVTRASSGSFHRCCSGWSRRGWPKRNRSRSRTPSLTAWNAPAFRSR